MDADRFDTLLRSLATSPSRRGALRLLAGSALGSLLMRDPLSTDAKKKGGGKKGGKKKCKGKEKVTICHKGQTIQVSRCAVKAHQKHGDTAGECQPSCTANCSGKNCGGNGCGGSCGECDTAAGEICVSGRCGIACSSNTDCAEMTDSCQGGQCQPVCTAQSCPGADCDCAVHHEEDGARSAVCYSRIVTDDDLSCENDDLCSSPHPLCLIQDDQTDCPTCKVCSAIEPCSCTENFDCYDMTFSCQGGQCKPVCTPESCPGDDCSCAVHVQSNGERTVQCYATITPSSIPCGGSCSSPGSLCLIREDHNESCPTSFCTDCSTITECPPPP